MIRMVYLVIGALLGALPVNAQMPDRDAYVASNLISIFYHELGHALIDRKQLPIFGQEEDAADVFSILMIDALYEEESAVEIAFSTASGFLGEAESQDAQGEGPAFWDVHGPDLQRYFNLVCLFYGANPDEREDVALDLGLPEERIDSCADEFDLANASWGPVLDELIAAPKGDSFVLVVRGGGGFAARIMAEELQALNTEFGLQSPMQVIVEPCGEANAFYDTETQNITMCAEFAEFLAESAPS